MPSKQYIPHFHLPSEKVPPTALPHVEFALLDFRSRLESSIHAAQITSKRKHNLTPSELSAYLLLKNRPDIVISKADKNLGTVVLNKEDYIAEGLRQLADRKYYSPVSSDNQALHDSLHRDLSEICKVHSALLSERDVTALFSSFPFKPAKFYMLPKIHKKLVDGLVPGRPIVSCIGYCTSPSSRFIDFHLKNIIHETANTVLADTDSLISKLANTHFPANSKVVTADVVSLYTNMNWHDTISAIDEFLKDAEHPLRPLLIALIAFVLKNNYFKFENVLYHQEHGMAMGTPMAVNVANAFLFIHEKKTLSIFKASIYLFERFIDDLFLVIDDKLSIESLQQSLYSDLPDINLTWSNVSDECVFLDLELFLDKSETNCNVLYRTYQKPRNAYLYIPYKSDHPKSNFRSFIIAELCRYNRTNSRLSDVLTIRERFWCRLRLRGYPPHFLAPIFMNIEPRVTHHSAAKKAKTSHNRNTITFVTSYHPHFARNRLRTILTESFSSSNVEIFYRKTKQLFH